MWNSNTENEQRVRDDCFVCGQEMIIPVFKKPGLPHYVLERHYACEDALAGIAFYVYKDSHLTSCLTVYG